MADLTNLPALTAASEAMGVLPADVLTGIVEAHERDVADESNGYRYVRRLVTISVDVGMDDRHAMTDDEAAEWVNNTLQRAAENAPRDMNLIVGEVSAEETRLYDADTGEDLL